jgi:hypothetical protein
MIKIVVVSNGFSSTVFFNNIDEAKKYLDTIGSYESTEKEA